MKDDNSFSTQEWGGTVFSFDAFRKEFLVFNTFLSTFPIPESIETLKKCFVIELFQDVLMVKITKNYSKGNPYRGSGAGCPGCTFAHPIFGNKQG